MQDEGAGDQLHLPRRHRRLPPRPHLRMRRQLLRPGRFIFFRLKLWAVQCCGRSKHHWIEDVAPRFETPKSIFSMCSWWYKLLDTFLQLHFAGHLRLSGVQHLADNLIWPFCKMSVITLFGISRKSTFWDGDQTSKAGSVEPTCSLEFNIGFRFEVMFRREVKSHKHASTWIHTLAGEQD